MDNDTGTAMGFWMLEPRRRIAILSKLATVVETAEDLAAKRLTLASDDNVVKNRNPIWKLLKSLFSSNNKQKVAYVPLPEPSAAAPANPVSGVGLPNQPPPKFGPIAKVRKGKAKPPKPSTVKNQGHVRM